MTKRIIIIVLLGLISFVCSAQRPEFVLTIKNHLFIPQKLTIPAHTKVKIIIINQDDKSEEFDSFDLNREKVIFPNQQATIYVGPLAPGEYHFFGEYHPNSAIGKVIVKEGKSHAN